MTGLVGIASAPVTVNARGFGAVWLALSLLCLACCGAVELPAGPDVVGIPPIEVPRARIAPSPIPAVYRLPATAAGGETRFPAVIVLHGCGGRSGGQMTWARRLNAWGYAALIPDSMTPRGLTSVCAPQSQNMLTPRDRVADVGAAAAWLRTRPEIDPDRIAVLGLSHGGSTAALSTQQLYAGFRLRAAVDYYGRCQEPGTQGDVPLLALAGEADDWGHPALACRTFGAGLAPGKTFEVHTYPGVYHAFENPSTKYGTNSGHILAYDAASAEDSFVHVRAFLARWVRRKGGG